ncbi:MAG: hypothetical protein A2Z17_00655 [Gammaproteobacteria bacterium RBG_16_66_13]|nr:MAG: hypothetical protein A2Z17_00655 [Gammaproteobacteria bacterium RBG_16_66_13]
MPPPDRAGSRGTAKDPGLPEVILHNAVSLDGRLDGFNLDVGLYYEIAGRLGADAILSGSNTILTAFADPPVEPAEESEPTAESEPRPLFAVVDSRGRVTQWRQLVAVPYWRAVTLLCSESTPREARSAAEAAGVEVLEAGKERVDLAYALRCLSQRYGVRRVRTDSGGTLNGVLLRRGLLDEASLLIHPVFAGPRGRLPLFDRIQTGELMEPVGLEMTSVETLQGGVLWLRARVLARGSADP